MATFTPVVSSTFTHANETPLADGGAGSAVWGVIDATGQFNLVSNAATPTDVGSDAAARYVGNTGGADTYCEANITVVNTTAGNGIGFILRQGVGADPTYYRIVFSHAASNNAEVARFDNDVNTFIGSWTVSFSDGDLLTVGVEGSGLSTTFYLFQGAGRTPVGSAVIDNTGAALSTGRYGLGFSSSVTSASMDNWVAGTFTNSGGGAITIEYVAPVNLQSRQGGAMIGRRYV